MGVGFRAWAVRQSCAFSPGSRVLEGCGWSPLQKVRVIQEQNLECQCPARLVAVNGYSYLELSTVTSLPLSGDRELGESVICKAFYCLAISACFIT